MHHYLVTYIDDGHCEIVQYNITAQSFPGALIMANERYMDDIQDPGVVVEIKIERL